MAVDLRRKHLFVAELGNNTIDAIDLMTAKPIHRITGLAEPQGLAYLPEPDLLVAANGDDGSVRFYSGTDFAPRGTLKVGDAIVVGQTYGRIRSMTNYLGEKMTEAGPSTPVEILGLEDVPAAGDRIEFEDDERSARVMIVARKE